MDTWHYIPEDGNIHNYRCENLKSYTIFTTDFMVVQEKLSKLNGKIVMVMVSRGIAYKMYVLGTKLNSKGIC
jgi:hypothetical protein